MANPSLSLEVLDVSDSIQYLTLLHRPYRWIQSVDIDWTATQQSRVLLVGIIMRKAISAKNFQGFRVDKSI